MFWTCVIVIFCWNSSTRVTHFWKNLNYDAVTRIMAVSVLIGHNSRDKSN